MSPAHFRVLTDHSFWCARVIGYPALSEGKEVGLSCGEHSDYGCWTILSQDILSVIHVPGIESCARMTPPMPWRCGSQMAPGAKCNRDLEPSS